MFEMTSNRSLLRAMMLYYVCMITAHNGHNITIFLIGASFFKPLHILYVCHKYKSQASEGQSAMHDFCTDSCEVHACAVLCVMTCLSSLIKHPWYLCVCACACVCVCVCVCTLET